MDHVIQRSHIYQFIYLFIYVFIRAFLKYRKCRVVSSDHLFFPFSEKHLHFIARDACRNKVQL